MAAIAGIIIGVLIVSTLKWIEILTSLLGPAIDFIIGVLNFLLDIFDQVVVFLVNLIISVVNFVNQAIANFNKFKAVVEIVFNTIRDRIESAFEGIGNTVKDVVNGIIGNVNSVIDSINTVIGLVNTVTGLGIGEIGTIPQFATGVTNFAGGPAIVGERGPELVNLPPGSDVIPARETEQILDQRNQSRNVDIGTVVFNNNMDFDAFMQRLDVNLQT